MTIIAKNYIVYITIIAITDNTSVITKKYTSLADERVERIEVSLLSKWKAKMMVEPFCC